MKYPLFLLFSFFIANSTLLGRGCPEEAAKKLLEAKADSEVIFMGKMIKLDTIFEEKKFGDISW